MNRPILISQHASASVPNPAELSDAVLWDCFFTFRSDDDVAFDVQWNGKPATHYTPRPEEGGVVAPVMKVDEDDPAIRTVAFRALDALVVQSARFSVSGVAFPSPLLPLLDVESRILIGGKREPVAAHFASLLSELLARSPFESQPASIEVHYDYDLAGIVAKVPVVLVTRHPLPIVVRDGRLDDAELGEQIGGAIRQWVVSADPPRTNAHLSFALTFWSAEEEAAAPVLRLADIALPMTDVVL